MSGGRYSRWDGSQDPFGERVDVGALLDQLGDDLLHGAGGRAALQRLLRQGVQGRAGLDALRDRVRHARAMMERDLDVGGPLDAIRDELADIVADERADLATRDDEPARVAELELDTLPRDPGGQLRALQEYAFSSPTAGARFHDLLERLRRDLLDSYLRELTGAMESVTPEDVARITEMLADLNDMLEQRARGEEPDFDAFMAKHGELFPEQPRTLDELLEVMARRAAAMSRMLASMTPEQRRQLSELAASVFDDLDLQFQLSQLAGNLQRVLPELPWGSGVPGAEPGEGQGEMPLSGMVDAFERIGELEDLEAALAAEHAGALLDDVDEEALRRHLGDDAVRDLDQLKRIERALEESGAMQRRGGELELTPRGARMLGERALTRLLERIRREPTARQRGSDPEPTGQTRPWRFGDREPLSVNRSLRNAVLREAGEGRDRRAGVRLRADDFEVAEQEVRPRTATALLLDLSFSMPLQGHFVPAKRMALALHALIEGKHRQDSLHLIGFSDYARRLQPADLAASGFERVYGTNMHHAFLLARRVLLDDPRPVKQVIMVTDGEPTAHLVDGYSEFNWPPVPETIEATLREAMRLARSGIRLNVFLLEDAPGLVAFAEKLADLTGGEVVQMRGEALGRRILHDYVARAEAGSEW